MAKLLGVIVVAGLLGAAFACAIIYSTFSYAYVADIFWSWFALPNFKGLPDFTYLQFVALYALKSIFFSKSPFQKDLKKEYYKENQEWNSLASVILTPWLILFVGWVVKTWFF